jgi:HEAT repeat protein
MTLGDLGNVEALALLKDRYGYESQPGKVQILKAIGKIPDESNIEFLRGVLEPSSELRLEAADALARIETFGIKGIETILRRSDEDLQAVARHILDNKISR